MVMLLKCAIFTPMSCPTTSLLPPQLTIKDLSWEDKELVLRVLFAKMNGVAAGASSAAHQVCVLCVYCV